MKGNILKLRYLDKKDWCDKDEVLIHAMFEVLCKYIEEEKPEKIVNWESCFDNFNAWQEIKSLYNWWKKRQNREKEDPLNKANPEPKTEEDKKKWKKAYKQYDVWEKKCDREDEEMMIKLIKIRKYLWV